MIDQELYIKILELFDILENETTFKEYKLLEKKLLIDKRVLELTNEYNEISDSLVNIDYSSYCDEMSVKLKKIEDELNKIDDYKRYHELYNECNARLVDLSEIIFKDIIGVDGGSNCASK